ncbi:MAG TPA: NAD(P)H-binding protein [Solirubrobacteraceae bacterium]|nr:NAD(P)H-binding protein [Solirubrobacteraceae bacterium]
MLLLTGATGTVGRALLRRLLADGVSVRCLVRDPRRLGAERVRVQIALGDLGDPASFRHALRDVDTVVHLASVIRDQRSGSIEELAGFATVRLVEAAEQAGVTRFLFFSTLNADTRSAVRFMRAKAVAERAVVQSSLLSTVFAPSIIYAPNDPYVTLIERMSLLPLMPIPGDGSARFAPIWSEDVADCVLATLPAGRAESESVGTRYELAGPDVLTHRQIVGLVLAAAHRRRRIVSVSPALTRRVLKAVERISGPDAFATWDEAELLDVPLLAANGTADCERLGVTPRSMAAVLGV